MDRIHEPQVPAKRKSRLKPRKRKSKVEKRAERILQGKKTKVGDRAGTELLYSKRPVAGPSEAALRRAVDKEQMETYKEQMQNYRWLHAQPDISKATRKELRRYFLCSRKEKQNAAPPLSEEGQALLQRLQDERRAALDGQIEYVTKNDWFKQPTEINRQASADVMHDLALLVDNTNFFKPSRARNRLMRLRGRVRSKLERLEQRGAEEKAAGTIREGDAIEDTKSMVPVTDEVDEMQLEGG